MRFDRIHSLSLLDTADPSDFGKVDPFMSFLDLESLRKASLRKAEGVETLSFLLWHWASCRNRGLPRTKIEIGIRTKVLHKVAVV
jgi:hypothetical protein